MPQSATLTGSRAEPDPVGQPQLFEKLRELTLNGYIPDAEPGPGGAMLLRHDNAPDLLLHPDGRIDLPVGRRPRGAGALPAPAPTAPGRDRGLSKRRTLLIVLLAVAFWFLSLALTSSILHG